MRRSSQESADSTSGSNAPDGALSASRRSIPIPQRSSDDTGRPSLIWETSPLWHDVPEVNSTPDSPALLPGKTGPAPDSSRAGSRAKTSRSGGDDADSLDHDLDSPSASLIWWNDTDLNGSSSRTSRDSSFPIRAETLGRSSVLWENSGMGGPSEFWTLSSSACPSDDAGCSSSVVLLPQVLTTTAPPRFWLSVQGAQGIIRRARNRGNDLPAGLREAIESLARSSPATPKESGTTGTLSSPRLVRRFTPLETERLMGYPDGWTIAPDWKKK